ncbi:MAG: hypothetical protein JWM34_4840 [Ilumatobacteraceae bacterium]|nr:hypothetical protein [Ilumatobacteraceae bacterium]
MAWVATTAVVAGGLAMTLAPTPVAAAGISVTTSADTSTTACTLRDAITAANTDTPTGKCTAGSGPDTISLNAPGPYDLLTPLPTIVHSLTIDGSVAGTPIIRPSASVSASTVPDFRVFTIDTRATPGSTVDLANLQVYGGRTTQSGGGVLASTGQLDLDHVVLANNSANVAGGALYANDAQVVVSDSTISGNTNALPGVTPPSNALASGIAVNTGSLSVVTSTFTDNSTPTGGAAVFTQVPTTIANSTFADNTGTSTIYAQAAAISVSITNSTITANTSSGVLGAAVFANGPIALYNTLVARQVVGRDCSSGVSADGANLDDDGTCGASATTSDPRLGVLANNGGPTRTFALLSSSPAIDAGEAAYCPATDQTGASRPQGPSCDIGAFEFIKLPTTVTVTPPPSTLFDGLSRTATAAVTGSGGLNQALTVTYTGASGTIYGPTATPPAQVGSYLAKASYSGSINNASSSAQSTFSILAPTLSGHPTTHGTVGVPYSFAYTVGGKPSVTIASGALPPGLTLSTTGVISGTPTAAGTFAFSVGADTANSSIRQAESIVVDQRSALSGTPPPGTLGLPYSFTFAVGGSPTPTVAVSAGALPPGLDVSSAGALTGTPTAPGTFAFMVTATNTVDSTSLAASITVTQVASSPPVGDFVPLAPARLADTRAPKATIDGLFSGTGVVAAGTTFQLGVAGRGGVATDASAVALNVTVTNPAGAGFVTVYPCGSAQPTASNLNFDVGATIPNSVIAKIGTTGSVCLFTSQTVDLVVDVNGYFPSTSTHVAINPGRLVDTRSSGPTVDGSASGFGPLQIGATTPVQVTGRAGVPSTATAVVLNVTVTQPAAAGFLTVFPCGSTPPTASNLNYTAGLSIPNLVVTKIGTNGQVCVFNQQATQLVVDVAGYFPAATTYVAVNPGRILDTRRGSPTIDGSSAGAGLSPAGNITVVRVGGRAGVPTSASTAVLNVTVVDPVGAGFVTVYPCGISPPLASNLNFTAGQTIPNAVISKIGTDGDICIFNSQGAQLVADVAGYFP